LQAVGGVLFVDGVSALGRTILDRALKTIAASGVARVSELSQEIPAGTRIRIDAQLVRSTLQTRIDISWLDDSRDWFWLTSVPRNPLVARIRKVLCVSPRITLLRLGQTISRDRKILKLPEPILRSYCASLSWCWVQDDRVEARIALGMADVLSGAEATICQILRVNGGVIRLPHLKRLCFEKGVTFENLWRVLSCSPVIRRFDRETHGLISAEATATETTWAEPELRKPTVSGTKQIAPIPNEIESDSTDLLILTTLARKGPMHCFSIADSVMETSEEVRKVDEALYPAIQRTVSKGWIKGEWRKTQENRRVRYYSLTADGRRQLENVLKRCQRAASVISEALKSL
jgi:DNA-binding PadR family transcriptional regulator